MTDGLKFGRQVGHQDGGDPHGHDGRVEVAELQHVVGQHAELVASRVAAMVKLKGQRLG